MGDRWMVNLQVKIAELMPDWLYDTLYGCKILPSYLQWRLHPVGGSRARAYFQPLKNALYGYRCVVIGNGPSLKMMDLNPLKEEYTIGLNRIYLMFESLGLTTDWLVAVNRFVLQQFSSEMEDPGCVTILNWRYRNRAEAPGPGTVFLHPAPYKKSMDGSILKGYYPHIGSVTNVALEMAFFLGFSEVILIGVDHNYQHSGTGSQVVESAGPDPDHFSADYFGKGTLWQLPDYQLMEHGFRENRRLFESDGRQIVDGTVAGKLDVFPKVDFYQHLQKSTYMKKGRKGPVSGSQLSP